MAYQFPSLLTRVGQRRASTEKGEAYSGTVYSPIVIALLACVVGVVILFAVLREAGWATYAAPLIFLTGAALLVQAWRRWETGLQALLVIVIVEGAIRKWLLPSYAELVYFYKDVLMVTVLGGYLTERRKAPFAAGRQLKVFFVVLAAFVIYAVAVVVNPSAPHIVASLFGLKAYCLYMPLVFLVPRMFTTKEKLAGFLRWYLVLALMVAALGVWQFMDGSQDSPLNRYAWSDEVTGGAAQDTALFVDSEGTYYVRVTSTFSFVTGLTVYLPVAFALLLGLTSQRSARTLPRALRLLYYATMGAVAATAFMTGSRSVIVGLALVAVVFYAFTALKDSMRRLRQLIVGGALILLTLASVAPQAVDALYQRTFGGEEQIEESRSRIMDVFSLPLAEAEHAGAFGYGIGATQNSVPALLAKLGLARTGEAIPVAVEGEAARVMLELGVVGFLLFTLLRLTMLVTLWRACVVIRDRETKALAVACFAALVFPLVAGGAVINHTQNVYQWFLVGTVFALLNVERQREKGKSQKRDGEPLLI